ncbi:MAG TPA: exodeoxyribonuclease V subunit gamma [Desulfuromonadales bacterium]|nr:exodeoxyribonuclease V subunit gamma [Desulfuromonadales bacterium]
MALAIYSSNRMEKLASALSAVLAQPLSNPLETEIIVVQSRGMQRWLAMELASTFGVWANCTYPFPNAIIWQLFGLVLQKIPETSCFSPEVMTWKLMELVPRFLDRPEFAPLLNYLAADSSGVKLFQLAEKIADVFDQYTLFRPEMLAEWENSVPAVSDNAWQQRLWKELVVGSNQTHRGNLREQFCRTLNKGVGSDAAFPERITLFGISYLPQYHLDVFSAVSRITDVNLFLLSPTREYWADIASSRAIARISPQEQELRSEGNPLLASLGKLGRDFSDMVINVADSAENQHELYEEPGDRTLLRAMQSDILNLTGAEERACFQPASDDCSVRVHSCHSPLREVEVLHDNLLAMFEEMEELSPRDIVVMAPDIEQYAAYITAVFGGSHSCSVKIPFSVADRKFSGSGQISATLLKIIELPGSRHTVVQLFEILEMPLVSCRFGLDAGELSVIRSWLENVRVRWGIDCDERGALGLPPYGENSWRAGLDRLLLGYAMTEESSMMFDGVLPFDGMEGSSAQTLGKLAEFVCRISDADRSLSTAHSLTGWREIFRNLLSSFIAADDDDAYELAEVSAMIESIAEISVEAGYGGIVQPFVIRLWLQKRLGQQQKGTGFMTGGVTFCAMLPMRSIPFRVVALLGMSDGAFPRQSRPAGFDLIAAHPQRGDRSLRDEDRYLFLEALLSARERFYISYVGQSVRDNSEIPPSVLVAEFMDAINRACAGSLKNSLVTHHRLQPFSTQYFMQDSPLFSYSEVNCAALKARRGQGEAVSGFIEMPLKAPPDEFKTVSLPQLLRFFDNPARYFMENRLLIRMEESVPPLEEREPFAVGGLEKYNLQRELLEILLKGGNPQELLPVVRCRGILPPAQHGDALFAGVVKDVTPFAETVRTAIQGALALEPLDVAIRIGEFTLTGRLGQIFPERMIRYRCSTLKTRDRLRAWIEHLVLNVLQVPGYPRETLLMMNNGSRVYTPPVDSAAILQDILTLYWQGLSIPLPFFPKSSMAYAEKGKGDLKKARTVWNDDGFTDTPGEGSDPSFMRCFGHADPFTIEFERIAAAVLGPMLAHQSGVTL